MHAVKLLLFVSTPSILNNIVHILYLVEVVPFQYIHAIIFIHLRKFAIS